MIVFDDVGWGDFGCYGGGVAVGAADAEHRPARPPGPAAHVVLLRAVVHAVARVADDRPAPDAPRAAAAADVRRGRRAAGRDHDRAAARRRRLRHPGGGQVAHGRERGVASPRTSASTTSTGSSASRTCTPSGATRTSSPRSCTARSARAGSRTSRSTGASCTRRRASELENVEEVTIPVLSAARRQVGRVLARLPAPDGRRRTQPWFLYHCTRGAHFDNYPHERFLGRRRRSTRTRTRSSSSTTSSAGWSRSSRRPASSRTRSSSSPPTTARRWRRGPTPRTRRSAARRARRGKAASGCPASCRGPG